MVVRFVAIERRRMRPDRLDTINAGIYLLLRESPGLTVYGIARALAGGRASFETRDRVRERVEQMESVGMIGRYYGSENDRPHQVSRRVRKTASALDRLDEPDEWMREQMERKRIRDAMRAVA